MNILGFVFLWFSNILTNFLVQDYVTEDFVIHSYEIMADVYNIFAWVNVFVPVNVLLVIFTSTTAYYGLKFVLNIVKYIISLFK